MPCSVMMANILVHSCLRVPLFEYVKDTLAANTRIAAKNNSANQKTVLHHALPAFVNPELYIFKYITVSGNNIVYST